jgi:hypothetical protein
MLAVSLMPVCASGAARAGDYRPTPIADAVRGLFSGAPVAQQALRSPTPPATTGAGPAPTTPAAMATARSGFYAPNAAIDPNFVRVFQSQQAPIDPTHPNADGHQRAANLPAPPAPKPKGMSWFEIQHLVALHKCPPVEKFVLDHRDTSMSWFDIEQMMTIYDCVLAPKQATPKIIIGPDGETSMIMP